MNLGELVDLLVTYKQYEDAVSRAQGRVFRAQLSPSYQEGATEWLQKKEAELAEAQARLDQLKATVL
jgi:hypothetical protein